MPGRRGLAALLLSSLLSSAALAACASRGGTAGSAPPAAAPPATSRPSGPTTSAPRAFATASTPPTTTAPATSTTVPGTPRFPVRVVTLTLTDGGRTLPTTVRIPEGRGPWPLIVFSGGFEISPEAYADLLTAWAAQGAVVADPVYPDTVPGGPGSIDEADIVNHPADLRAVIAALIAAHGPLAGTIDPTRVGIAGQSDGGDVTAAVASAPCCTDHAVKAAIVLAGAELAPIDTTYGTGTIPTLVVQGDADPINPPACSQQLYDILAGARYYLDLLGAGHHSPWIDPPLLSQWSSDPDLPRAAAYQRVVTAATEGFWSQWLGTGGTGGTGGAGGTGETGWQRAASVPGVSRLTQSSPVPVSGTCPGAPRDGSGSPPATR